MTGQEVGIVWVNEYISSVAQASRRFLRALLQAGAQKVSVSRLPFLSRVLTLSL